MQLSVHSQYGKHIPKILRRQLILQLMEQYLNVHHEDTLTTSECKPSIQRFHGALLFVDISGFTALSLQLSPEDLKFHINEYFTKMLDIVDKHGGDVIKFAGDALFIIWETSQMMKLSNEHEIKEEGEDTPLTFSEASTLAVSTAVECGLEINEVCSNHRVSLLPRNAAPESSFSISSSFSAAAGSFSSSTSSYSAASTATTPTSHHAAFACLNVHSGVTVGLMAGIDIGCNDRWEFFLMGEPLTSVAMAEAQASTGEIVICPDAHDLLHPANRPTFNRALARISIVNSSPTKRFKRTSLQKGFSSKYDEIQGLKKTNFDESAVDMPCGCLKGSNGYCKIKRSNKTPTSNTRRNKLKTKFEEGIFFDETNNEIEAVFDTFVGHRLQMLTSIQDIQNEFIKDISNAVTLNVTPVRYAMSSVVKAALNVKTMGDRVKTEFVKWAHSCLIDDIARHVHDVVRSNYNFEDTSRIDVCRREITKQLATLQASESVMKAKDKFRGTLANARQKKLERQASVLDGTKKFLKKTMTYARLGVSGKSFSSSSKSGRLFDQDSEGFSAEIRSVTVMFVKIDMPHMDLTVENMDYGENLGQFGFLSKTVNESLADVLLLHQLQSCMEALNESFSTHGGQLRQFIVDDKGTVCIGTFGLRGAVNDDNAASAIETAFLIVNKLQALGLNCSIGVTVGKAFCGLVGSANRHEYAVMGPSTNLSARLMCKAPLGSVICDREIRSQDRAHQFVTLADIVAKGYAQPVGTCKPILKGADEPSYRSKLVNKSRSSDISSSSVGDRRISVSTVDESGRVVNRLLQKLLAGPFVVDSAEAVSGSASLMGRDNEVRGVLAFLFSSLLVGDESKFKTDLPTRFAGVLGSQGIGKSSVLAAVSHQVSSVVVSGRHLPVDVLKTKMSGFQSTVPCSAWKYVIRDMLIKLYKSSKNKNSSIRRLGAMALSVDLGACINHAMSLMPAEWKKFDCLFGYLKIVPEQAAAVKELELSHDELVAKCIELLREIIRLHSVHTQRLVLILAENVHIFDVASQLLLYQVCTSSVGLVVLFSSERVTPLLKVNTPKLHGSHSMSHEEESHIIEEDAVTLLTKHDACYTVDLTLLHKEQINALVKTTLSNAGIASIDDRVLDKIYAESGGNPMYACELAKTVALKHSEQIDLTRVSVKIINCHRLEEIICHRFDQLSNSAQSLLKIAAAMCRCGPIFTYKMLHFVMVEDEQEDEGSTDDHIVQDLLDIVNSESFLRATHNGPEDDNEGDGFDFHEKEITADDIRDNAYSYSFSISLEKTTIYELLLGDQKQAIHERVAEYFRVQRMEEPTAKHHFNEEGMHWQLASNWIYAMACSYHASLVETNEHKAGEHIDTAFRMYRAMRNQSTSHKNMSKSPSKEVEFQEEDWDVKMMKTLFDLSVNNSEDLTAINDSSHLTVDEVSQLFNCDSELLLVSLKVIIARTRRALGKESAEDNRITLEDALQMLLLTKSSRVLSTVRVNQLMELLRQSASESADLQDTKEEHYFTVGEEFNALFLKIASLYVENYVHLEADEELSKYQDKAMFLFEKFNTLRANLEGFHELHSLTLSVRLSCKELLLPQACASCEKLVISYQTFKHSSDLVSFYGCDCIPAALAMVSQYLLLSSDWKTSHRFLTIAKDSLESLTHVESIGAAVYFVTNNLVFLKKFDEALKIFTHYLDCIATVHEDRSMRDGFYLEWLNRLVRSTSFESTQDESIFAQDAEILNEFVQGKNHLLEKSADILNTQGRGVDAVLAELCALKIMVLWKKETTNDTKDLMKYCRSFCEYVAGTLTMSSGRPHELMLNKTAILLVVIHLLQQLMDEASSESSSARAAKRSVLVKQKTGENLRDLMTHRADLIVNSIDTDKEKDLQPENLFSKVTISTKRGSIETEEEKPLNRTELLKLILEVVDDVVLSNILTDCQKQLQQPYSLFTLLALSVLSKTKNEVSMSLGVVGNPPSFDVNKEVWKHLHLLMSSTSSNNSSGNSSNDSNGRGGGGGGGGGEKDAKLRVLLYCRLSEMASAMTSDDYS